jgi:hypothetical protein
MLIENLALALYLDGRKMAASAEHIKISKNTDIKTLE